MAHKAERIRRRKIREMEYFQQEAERYGLRIDAIYNQAIVHHYVIIDHKLVDWSKIYQSLPNGNFDFLYDKMIREVG